MKSLRAQITMLAIGISVAAALVAAFVPLLVFKLRDFVFLHSLALEQQTQLQSMSLTLGKCSPKVAALKHALGSQYWEVNYDLALAALITFTALLMGWIASRYARAIAAPIVRLAEVASTIARGERAVNLLPQKSTTTELMQLAEGFADMAHSLAAADQDLQLRSKAIAHELRTPLAVIRGRLIGIQAGLFRPDAVLVDALLRQVGLIEQLTQDLSLLCDTQGQGTALERAPVALADLLMAVVQDYAPIAHASWLRLHFMQSTDVIVAIDATRIERAVVNLVANAIKHSQGHSITVSLTRHQDWLHIDIDDDGIGWPAGNLAALLEPFVTGQSQAAARSASSGLGLAIALAIAKAHHGGLVLGASTLGGAQASLRLRYF
jgi:two-component system, OmpR family, sensor histidine kinase AdeS